MLPRRPHSLGEVGSFCVRPSKRSHVEHDFTLDIGASEPRYLGMPNHKAPCWQTILGDMERTGMSRVEIARAVSLSPASITNMMSGKVLATEYANGIRILAAHKAAMRKAPKVPA